MRTKKFRADLYKYGQHPGYITISDTTFKWKPMIGHNNEVELPIDEVTGYAKSGFLIWTTLYLQFKRYNMVEAFWGGWNVNSIIKEIKNKNPYVRYIKIKKESNWLKDNIWYFIAIIGTILYLFFNH